MVYTSLYSEHKNVIICTSRIRQLCLFRKPSRPPTPYDSTTRGVIHGFTRQSAPSHCFEMPAPLSFILLHFIEYSMLKICRSFIILPFLILFSKELLLTAFKNPSPVYQMCGALGSEYFATSERTPRLSESSIFPWRY